jgi:hypothetical protein
MPTCAGREEILTAPVLRELLDLSQPVGVLVVAVLHFLTEDDRPDDTLRQFRELVTSGSYLVISHVTGQGRVANAEQAAQLYRATSTPITWRTPERICELFTGWELVEPGVVWVSQWRPDWPDEVGPDPASTFLAAGVGRKA